MAGEQSTGAGGGAGAPVGGTPAAPVGGAPAGAPGGPGAAGAPAEPQARVIAEDVLPEQLRGKSPQEVKFILGQMASGLARQQARIAELETASRSAAPAEPAEPKKPVEERILEDPEGVIAEVVQKLYGGRVAQIESGVEEVVEHSTARELPDWEDMKEDVYSLLRDAGAPKTKANIEMAYDTVTGRRARESKRISAAAALNPDIPPDRPVAGALPELHGLEKEIFEASGMSREEWEKYGDSGSLDIKVPTGKKVANV